MVSASASEEGCLQYTLHDDRDHPDCLVPYERWAGRPALAAHDETAHVKTFMAALPDLLIGSYDRWPLRRLTDC